MFVKVNGTTIVLFYSIVNIIVMTQAVVLRPVIRKVPGSSGGFLVGFVREAALKCVFIEAIFPPVSIIQPVRYIHLFLYNRH